MKRIIASGSILNEKRRCSGAVWLCSRQASVGWSSRRASGTRLIQAGRPQIAPQAESLNDGCAVRAWPQMTQLSILGASPIIDRTRS